MVNKLKSSVKKPRGGSAPAVASVQSSAKEVIFVRSSQQPGQHLSQQAGQHLSQQAGQHLSQQAGQHLSQQAGQRACQQAGFERRAAAVRSSREAAIEEEADDVIDLGAPRRAGAPVALSRTARRALPPNPRLYPGPKPRPQRAEAGHARRRKRTLRRPVPNSRLYRPGPARPPAPPPARPRAAWPPPAPPRALDTASRAALRLGGARPPSPSPAAPRQLVVTLPEVAARYRPASEHFRARAAPDSGESTPPAAHPRPRAMEAAPRRSPSPEDRSEANETLSAPSEFLAEFLSAIMRRQYAEALKYCRLILQYEPHNATARGFYPLLRHKVTRAQRSEAATEDDADGSGDDVGVGLHSAEESPSRQEELMEHSVESEGESEASAAGEHSELELDSSDALHSSPSLSLSRRTDSASAGCWESSGSASASRSEADTDDNGNAAPLPAPAPGSLAPHQLLPDDLENDNAAAAAGGGEPHRTTHLKSESVSSLRRLRAQFACSIK